MIACKYKFIKYSDAFMVILIIIRLIAIYVTVNV